MRSRRSWARSGESGAEATRHAVLGSSPEGLSSSLATARLASEAGGRLATGARESRVRVFAAQFRSAILWILLAAAGLSAFLHDPTDALIILAIVLASAALGAWQEWRASDAVAQLLARVKSRATVLRDARVVEILAEQVVAGDVIRPRGREHRPGRLPCPRVEGPLPGRVGAHR